MTNREELEKAKRHLESLKNAANKQLLSSSQQIESVRLLVDQNVSPGMFRPHKSSSNIFFANSLTIRAVKKDLFLAGEGFEDLKRVVSCTSCNQELDEQFWSFCPYCEGKLSK
tara:strand:+ start:2760 stop:3098 length:339 start_codon:yes stop_codon:yes gene_type:complete